MGLLCMKEISIEELFSLSEDSYTLIDIRDEAQVQYGMIPGAVHISLDKLEEEVNTEIRAVFKAKKLVFYCQIGRKTKDLDDLACLDGRECLSLKDGYIGYIRSGLLDDRKREEKKKKVEESIQKKFHTKLFSPFARACREYQLIDEGDHIAICISGGKDSMLMAKLFQEILRHGKVRIDFTFLVMDPGYNGENRDLIESNAKALGIPVTIFESEIFNAVDRVEKNPCYICARMRRGYLYRKAKDLGCNKIALGHHYDDVIETVLMGMLYAGQFQTMMPKIRSIHFEGMELIRPLYLVREKDICAWRDYNDLHFLQCACHFTDTCSTCHLDGTTSSKRLETKRLISELKKVNPCVEANIFKSIENVNLDAVIGYKKEGIRHSFLEEY